MEIAGGVRNQRDAPMGGRGCGALVAFCTLDVEQDWEEDRCMDEGTELPGMPAPRPPKRGSRAWVTLESKRYDKFLRKEGGAVAPFIAALMLGVSRQRVHQLIDSGHLDHNTFFERIFIGFDTLMQFKALERSPQFRYDEIAA